MPEFSRRGAAGAAPAGTPLACRRISAHSHHRGRSPGSVCPSAPGRSACPAAPTGTAPWKDPEQGPCSTVLVKHGAHQGLSSGETGAAAETGGARGEYQPSSGLVERGTGAAGGDGRPIGREPPGAQGLFTAWDRPPSRSMRPVCSAALGATGSGFSAASHPGTLMPAPVIGGSPGPARSPGNPRARHLTAEHVT